MNIAIDIDGIIADFQASFWFEANECFPGILEPGYLPKDWEYSDRLTRKHTNVIWDNLKIKPDWWTHLNVYPHNKSILKDFLYDNFGKVRIYYVTSRIQTAGDDALTQTNYWLDRKGLLQFNTSCVIKPLGQTKGQIYDALDIKMSIDDYPKNVRYAVSENHLPYLLDREWNRLDKDLDPCRLYSLQEFLTIVKQSL